MASTTEALSRKLESGENLHSVVTTMKGLASVSIHEYEEAVRAVRSFTRTIDLGYQILFRVAPGIIPAEPRRTGRTAAILIGSDQGLCGSLNREIVDFGLDWIRREAEPSETPLVAAVGIRLQRDLELQGATIDEGVSLPGSVASISLTVQDLIIRIDRWRSEEDVGRVVVFHQRPIRRTERQPAATIVDPPDLGRLRRIAKSDWPTNMIPAVPAQPRKVLESLTREALSASLFRALAEARAAEHGARLTAMQSAEQNISERIERLRNRYHQVRQAEITAELLDVVSGFEALEGG